MTLPIQGSIGCFLRELCKNSPFWESYFIIMQHKLSFFGALHFRNHTKKIKKSLKHLVIIFHPPSRYLECIKHKVFNCTLYVFLQVCICYGTVLGFNKSFTMGKKK